MLFPLYCCHIALLQIPATTSLHQMSYQRAICKIWGLLNTPLKRAKQTFKTCVAMEKPSVKCNAVAQMNTPQKSQYVKPKTEMNYRDETVHGKWEYKGTWHNNILVTWQFTDPIGISELILCVCHINVTKDRCSIPMMASTAAVLENLSGGLQT